MNNNSLSNIHMQKVGKRFRSSSYDRKGGNLDFVRIRPQAKISVFNEKGAGCIKHIWMTLAPTVNLHDTAYLARKIVIRMFWDEEVYPSVEVPIGDFFGVGHGKFMNFVSAPFQMSPQDGKALNCFLPMPYGVAGRIEVENQSEIDIKVYYYIDYEKYETEIDSTLRFHAKFNRALTSGIDDKKVSNAYFSYGGENCDGNDNYILFEAEGRGHYIGCHLDIHNLRFTREWNWYGEGDDMIFIDGEPWPPRLHGTGMEDYFNTAWCPTQEYQAPYHGILMGGGENWHGRVSFYRYHILDPIMFEKSIKVTIEHGHANHRSDDYTSTAYWYQTEPHLPNNLLMPVNERLPLDEFPKMDRNELIDIFELSDLVDKE